MARILIADDDPDVREMIGKICEFRGHETADAPDAARAMTVFEQFEPQLVIADLAMPVGGGQALVRQMRASDAGRDVPVIVLSGYTAVLDRTEREELSAVAILDKPVDVERLMEAIDAALNVAS